MKKAAFILALKVINSNEKIYISYVTELKHVLKDIKKIRDAHSRYETASLHRMEADGKYYTSPGKFMCEYQLIPKYYSRSKDEYYF